MRSQILFSLILAMLFFIPSYAQEGINEDPLTILKRLHNVPDVPENNPDVQKILSELKEQQNALKGQQDTQFANVEEQPKDIENMPIPDGLDGNWE